MRVLLALAIAWTCFVWQMPYVTMPDEFRHYYKEYVKLINRTPAGNGAIVFARGLPTRVLGYCNWEPLLTWKIEISADYWYTMSENDRMALIAHELTHCTYWVQHTKDPLHYMYPILPYEMPFDELKRQVQEFSIEKNRQKMLDKNSSSF